MSKENRKILSGIHLIITLSLVLFPPQYTHAQSNSQGISGKVRDGVTMDYLGSVNLIIVGSNMGTISKSDGSFVITGIPEGIYELQASMIGYQPASHTVQVNKNAFTHVHIDLNQEIVSIDSVVIIGQRRQNYISSPGLEPVSLSVGITRVGRDEIIRQGAVTLIDAMKYIPGAFTETRGRKVKQFFSVRGQKYPYPDYAINGIWQKEFHELPYFISAGDIEEVEIIRSSAALLTGLSGLAGVINIKTRSYDQAETSAELGYGTFNTLHFHASHGGKHDKFSYASGIGYNTTAGPDQKNAAEEISNAYGSINWQPFDKLDVIANLYYLTGKRELTLAEPPATRRLREEISSFDQVRSTLSNVKIKYTPGNRATTEAHIYYSDRNPVFRVVNINTQETSFISEKDHEYGLNLIQAINLSSRNTLRFGGLYNRWIAPEGKRFYVGRPCDLETISGVITDEHIFGALTMDGGIRWSRTYMNEYGAFDIGESGAQFRNVTPITNEWQPGNIQASLGFTWNISSNSSVFYHAAAGKIKPREGSLDEDFKDPLNETRSKLDIGWETKWEKNGKLGVTGFFVNRKDAISLSGGTYDSEGITLEFYQNRDENQYGIEVETQSPVIWNVFSIFANITAMQSTAEQEGKMKKNTEFPEIIANGGVNVAKYGFDFNLFCKYVSKFESSRFVTQVQGEPLVYAPLGDFFTGDISAGYTFGSTFKTRAYVNVQNITDKRYSTVAGYPDFGRQFRFGMRVTI